MSAPVSLPLSTVKPSASSVSAEVKSRSTAGTGVHGRAKAGWRGLGAVDRNDQRLAAASRINRVDIGAFEEDSILHPDRSELAGPHTQESILGLRLRRRPHLPAVTVAIGSGHRSRGREEKLFPRVRSDDKTEQRLVVAPHQPITGWALHLGPATRQVIDRIQPIVDDRALADRRADDFIATTYQSREQQREVGFGQPAHAGRIGVRRRQQGAIPPPRRRRWPAAKTDPVIATVWRQGAWPAIRQPDPSTGNQTHDLYCLIPPGARRRQK